MADNATKLAEQIIKMSQSKRWHEAKLEWQLERIYEADEPQICLCGHYPIIEVCVISNSKTGNSTEVGNQCVHKFMGLPTKAIFSAYKKVSKDSEKSFNLDSIFHAKAKRMISQKDFDFYWSIINKRFLSIAQMKWKQDINRRIIIGLN